MERQRNVDQARYEQVRRVRRLLIALDPKEARLVLQAPQGGLQDVDEAEKLRFGRAGEVVCRSAGGGAGQGETQKGRAPQIETQKIEASQREIEILEREIETPQRKAETPHAKARAGRLDAIKHKQAPPLLPCGTRSICLFSLAKSLSTPRLPSLSASEVCGEDSDTNADADADDDDDDNGDCDEDGSSPAAARSSIESTVSRIHSARRSSHNKSPHSSEIRTRACEKHHKRTLANTRPGLFR